MEEQIKIEQLNRTEALRYMGQFDGHCDATRENVMQNCEEELLKVVKPRYLYQVFDIQGQSENDGMAGGVGLKGSSFVLIGQDIQKHLKDCEKVVLMCATLSSEVDALIRKKELQDVLAALAVDCLASTAVEQLCDKVELQIKKQFPDYEMTWRYGIGYGDLPISLQKDFLNVLNAPKRIGLNVTNSNILTPRKSVTAVIGLSHHKIEATKRGCAVCNMRDNCQYRKKGSHCNV